MRLTLPDALIDAYQPYADAQGRSVEEVIAAQLHRFVKQEPGRRAVILGKADLETLETALGGLPLRSGADVVERVSRLAGVTFAHVHLGFNPAQLAELAHRADRQGRPAEALVKDAIDLILREFFHTVGGVVSAPAPASASPAA